MIEFKNSELEKQKAVEDSTRAINATVRASYDYQRSLRISNAQHAASVLNSGFELAKVFASKNEKLAKAIGITQAIINTAVGVTNALATVTPWPAAVAAAAATVASGAAQIASISSAGSSSTPSPVTPSTAGYNGTATANTSEADQSLAQQAALEGAIANLGLTVSVTEINDAQNNVQVTQDTSTI